jgi:thiol-disulfide isomerase/thioredoxin
MHRQKIAFLLLLVATIGALFTVSYAKGWSPTQVLQFLSTGTRPAITINRVSNDASAPLAPELTPGEWINSRPLSLQELRGRVVVVDFWTFGCYNCRNTLPAIKSWDARYRNKGLIIIGVHTPEFDTEMQSENLKREVAELGLQYPVVTDNEYSTWKAYSVEAWPTIFVLDKSGRIRWQHVGEGAYAETEQVIQKLLAEEPNQQSGSKR